MSAINAAATTFTTIITIYLGLAPQWLKSAFSNYGIKVIEIGALDVLPTPVAHHIDLMCCGGYIAKEIEGKLPGKPIKQNLGNVYPLDVPLNAAIVGEYIICNPDTVAPELLELGLKLIPVKQGYTKCSTLVIDETHIITEDESIYEATKDILNVLFIEKGHVFLEGYDYGFIGGASAVIGDTVFFFGNIEKHPDFKKIKAFSPKRIISLSEKEKLIDIGGVWY
ncbi:MAG: hypothetical protein GX241_04560 [Ruminococcaceae bacterium]|nr:hypothetical protein [Oscillospiraceae bacterium]